MTPRQNELEGILLLDKPSGLTSHDVVDRVRRKLHMKRVGHAGTLDPMATGLLIMLVGKATKVSQYLMSLDKAYECVARFGQETNSHDCDGEIVTEISTEDLTEEKIHSGMEEFRGDQYQTPPMFSAKKVKGVPLYKHARKGREVEREARFIHVSQFSLLGFDNPDARFSLRCSKGTYVRTIAHDLGQKLGYGAHLVSLRRTEIDRFRVEDAATLEEFEEMSFGEVQRILIPAYQAVPSNVL